MWGWLVLASMPWWRNRRAHGDSGRTILVALFLLTWLVLGLAELAAAVWPW